MEWQNLVREFITGALVVGFIAVFLQEALTIWRKQKSPENEARTYVWTAISVLVGSITAFSFGVKFPDHILFAGVAPPDTWRAIYAIIYTILGLGAVVTWSVRSDWTSTLMKNLATTFLGIAIPVVSSWLIANPDPPPSNSSNTVVAASADNITS